MGLEPRGDDRDHSRLSRGSTWAPLKQGNFGKAITLLSKQLAFTNSRGSCQFFRPTTILSHRPSLFIQKYSRPNAARASVMYQHFHQTTDKAPLVTHNSTAPDAVLREENAPPVAPLDVQRGIAKVSVLFRKQQPLPTLQGPSIVSAIRKNDYSGRLHNLT